MKRSEMVDHIKKELLEFVNNYNKASDEAKPHKVGSSADGILATLEGFGMAPLEVPTKVHIPALEGPGTYFIYHAREWESENEN